MPELPEVEAARRAIEDNCVNKKIKSSKIADDQKVVVGVSPSDFESSINGKTIVAAHRKGKNLWLQLDSPPFPSFQFGMSGAVYIKGVDIKQYKRSAVSNEDDWPSKHSKVFLKLDDGLELSFTDKRRFARVRLLPDPATMPPISELGPDALFEPIKLDEFVDALSKKKIGIKVLLLDQSFISGIGNWLADEVLYQARIHPQQIASSLSRESCESLHQCIKEVIQYAVEVDADSNSFPIEWLFHFRWGKKSGKVNGKILYICDHVNHKPFILQVIEKAVEVGADGSQYPSNWIFHSREKKPWEAFVDGKRVEFITAGGRTTAYVPELQKLSGAGKTEKKPRKAEARKKESDEDSIETEEPESVEERDANPKKSKKGEKASKGTKKQQVKASKSTKKQPEKASEDDLEEQTQKQRAAAKKQSKATEESTKKRSVSSKGGTKQKKKARK